MKVSEKNLCRVATKDQLAHALVKIYEGGNATEIIKQIVEPVPSKKWMDKFMPTSGEAK